MAVRHLTNTINLSPMEIRDLFELTDDIKRNKRRYSEKLKGKKLSMIFEKHSTRTRVSFEVAMYELGGHALFLSKNDIQLGRGETIEDTARVLSRYTDGITIRTFEQEKVERLASASSVPVINALSDRFHPCQALADFFTIWEKKGKVKGIKFAYVGDGNNVANSLLLVGSKLGVHIWIASPEGYEPDEDVVKTAEKEAKQTGGSVNIVNDPRKAVENADVVYTDVWASMGQESEAEERKKVFAPYQVNSDLVSLASPDYFFMHCLPAHRGEEVVDEVIDDERHSIVWDEAENRLHIQKAILLTFIGSSEL